MVFVCVFDKTNFIFIDPGVKINGTYCRDVLLTEQLLTVVCEISGEFFVFQQNTAPCRPSTRVNQPSVMGDIHFHFTRHVAFNNPDLNPVDYRIWGEM